MKYFTLKITLTFCFFLQFSPFVIAQNTTQNNNKSTISGKINLKQNKKQEKILEGIVALKNTSFQTNANETGIFSLKNIPYGTYIIVAFCLEKQTQEKIIIINSPTFSVDFLLEDFTSDLDEVTVQAERERTFGITRLRSVENFGIYEGKKNEVIVLKDMNINLATNNARQVYAKITGLNIWESDGGAGLQLGIGGRGLSPDRTTNFNTRQNGYDISADALGYPEAYYTPPAEALERIEVVRGAASLQYGTQFGGMVNFLMKKGEITQNNSNNNTQNNQITALTRLSAGSWGFLSSFNSVSGQAGKLNFYAYYQHKQGNGFRQNSGFKSNNAFISLNYQVSTKFLINVDITKMQYLAQQAGGLTDKMFQENVRQSVRNRNFFEVDWNLFSANFTYKFSEKTQLNIRNFALSAGRQSVGNLERINVADLGGERTLVAGKFQNIGNEIRLLHRYTLGFGNNSSANSSVGATSKKSHTLLVGTRIYRGTTSAKQGNGTNGNDANFSYLNPTNLENSDYAFPNKNYAVFAENIFNITDKFSLTPGARFENIQTFSNGYYKQRVLDGAGNVIVENKIQENQERKRNFVLFGLGASYKLSDKIEFYGNISQNYRAINFSDLRIVNPNFFIDPNIQDEKGFTADMGVRGSLEDFFTFESTLFLLSYQGKIGQILRADQPPLFNDYRLRTNIADARNIGLELFGEVSLLKLFNRNQKNSKENSSENKQKSPFQWTIFTNLSLISAQYINTQEASIKGKKVEMVPPITLKTGTSFKYKKFASTLQFAYIGEHFSDATNAKRTSTAVEGIIFAYKIMDLSMNYEWKTLKLEASINNILNEKYFTRRAEFYPGPGIIPADGRGFYVTLQMQIK